MSKFINDAALYTVEHFARSVAMNNPYSTRLYKQRINTTKTPAHMKSAKGSISSKMLKGVDNLEVGKLKHVNELAKETKELNKKRAEQTKAVESVAGENLAALEAVDLESGGGQVQEPALASEEAVRPDKGSWPIFLLRYLLVAIFSAIAIYLFGLFAKVFVYTDFSAAAIFYPNAGKVHHRLTYWVGVVMIMFLYFGPLFFPIYLIALTIQTKVFDQDPWGDKEYAGIYFKNALR
jgi:hypothetical protein